MHFERTHRFQPCLRPTPTTHLTHTRVCVISKFENPQKNGLCILHSVSQLGKGSASHATAAAALRRGVYIVRRLAQQPDRGGVRSVGRRRRAGRAGWSRGQRRSRRRSRRRTRRRTQAAQRTRPKDELSRLLGEQRGGRKKSAVFVFSSVFHNNSHRCV